MDLSMLAILAFIFTWMLPKCILFHLLRAVLVWFNFLTKHRAGKPKTLCFQAASITRPHVGSKDQNSSNLKGLGRKAEEVFVFKRIGL